MRGSSSESWLFANEPEVDVLIGQSQQMVLCNLIFQPEVIEQRLRTRVLTHYER